MVGPISGNEEVYSETMLSESLREAEELGLKVEMVHGLGIWHMQPSKRHYKASTRISRSVRPDPQLSSDCACFVMEDVLVRFGDGSLLRPDIAIYCREPDEEDTAVTLIPQAVVEIVSVDSGRNDYEIKPPFYLSQGVKDVIVHDPMTGATNHYRRDRATVRHQEPIRIALECGCLVDV